MGVAKPKAVVLLSGGLDSTTTLAVVQSQGYDIYALTCRYGQRHDVEVVAARRIASRFGATKHVVVQFDLALFGGSALTADIPVPKGRGLSELAGTIPVTYVPARNTIFLSFALAWAETLGANDIFLGVNARDYSGYPDCRPEYIEAYERMANLATKAGVEAHQRLKVHTPLITLSKAEIIQRGLDLGVEYSHTVTCYDPSPQGEACGDCDACLLRLKGFSELGLVDPGRYRAAVHPPRQAARDDRQFPSIVKELAHAVR